MVAASRRAAREASPTRACARRRWKKLFPKLKDEDFDKAWLNIDGDGDGELSLQELASHYGFNLSPSANRRSARESMSDEQILETLQLSATLADMQARPSAPTAPRSGARHGHAL